MQPDNGEPTPKSGDTFRPGQPPAGAVPPFRFEMVVPYRKALSPEVFRHSTVRLLLFFALFPLLLGFTLARMRTAPGLEQTAWLLGIYYASIWGVVLHNLIKPPRISWRLTGACVLFTIVIGIPLLLLLQQFPPIRFLYAAAGTRQLVPSLIGFIGGVGILEESCKALSVYFVLLRPNRLHDPLSGAFYGAMSGLGFAISEGVLYSVRYAMGLLTELAARQNGFGDYLLANTIRFVSLPLFHAIWAGIVGYFLGLAAINPSRRKPIIAIGIAIAAVLHGAYNTFASGLLGIAVMAFSILLFVTYLRESRQIVEMLRQAEQQGKSP
jgi:RsiW-degrading membrane proteinase PrsW (M82 family)